MYIPIITYSLPLKHFFEEGIISILILQTQVFMCFRREPQVLSGTFSMLLVGYKG